MYLKHVILMLNCLWTLQALMKNCMIRHLLSHLAKVFWSIETRDDPQSWQMEEAVVGVAASAAPIYAASYSVQSAARCSTTPVRWPSTSWSTVTNGSTRALCAPRPLNDKIICTFMLNSLMVIFLATVARQCNVLWPASSSGPQFNLVLVDVIWWFVEQLPFHAEYATSSLLYICVYIYVCTSVCITTLSMYF